MSHKIARYGWIVDKQDHRDMLYSAPEPVISNLPQAVDLRNSCPPIYDQGQLGSCTANAISAAFEFDLMKQKLVPFTPSRLFIYYNERVIEGTVNQDSGAMIRDGIKSINTQGVCTEDEWPYDYTKFNIQPSQNCYDDAKKNLALLYKRIDQDIEQMQSCLAEGYPFVFGITVFDSFESQDVAQSGVLNLPADSESQVGGHAVLAVGYDIPNQRFIVRNSWGADWGQNGYFTIPFEYLTNAELANDFWSIRLVENLNN